MPSSFMVKRNYANCPLKKRPLALYNETTVAPEQDHPEDLSVKKAKLEVPSVTSVAKEDQAEEYNSLKKNKLHYVQPQYPTHMEYLTQNSHFPSAPVLNVQKYPDSTMVESHYKLSNEHYNLGKLNQNTENMPSLAEYYLQLFRATSEAEKKESARQSEQWNHHYLPPSPQSSPVAADHFGHLYSPSGNARFHSPSPLQIYPESSALISPVSSCSSIPSDDEESKDTTQFVGPRSVRHSCDNCGKSYSTPSGLSKHKQLHCVALGPRLFSCKHCSKTYTSVGALKMHIRTHTLPCKCHICGKAFSRPWLLQGHIRTHTGEKPFDCPQCERSFADRSNLRAHLQTHAHVKKYACHGCHKTFSRMSLLNKHSESACIIAKSSSPVSHQSAAVSPQSKELPRNDTYTNSENYHFMVKPEAAL